jgi:hypothetical protein
VSWRSLTTAVTAGAQDRASPNFMGLASLGLDIDVFCNFIYSVLQLNVILGVDFLGLAYPGRRCMLRREEPEQVLAVHRQSVGTGDGWAPLQQARDTRRI